MSKQEANEKLWNTSCRFTAAVNTFLGSFNMIDALTQICNPHVRTVTANKRRLGQSLINRTMEMAAALARYASLIGDEILSARTSMSSEMLARAWDPVISATAQSIHDLADEMIKNGGTQADQCGITPERNQLLLNAIVAFSSATGIEHLSRNTESLSLNAELRRAEEILNAGIDPLILVFKSQSEAFFASYRQAKELAEALPTMLNQ